MVRLSKLSRMCRRVGMGFLFIVLVAAVPGLASAQFYEYSATGTISKVQAVDAAGNDVAGYDYSKFTAAGITVGGSASYLASLDSATPDSTDPPDVTQGTYADAWVTLTIGAVTMSRMDLNNAVAVLDNRLAGQDDVPFAHDAFALGGSMARDIDGPSWIGMNNGTEADRKGSALILVEVPTTGALTGNGLPTSLNLATFNLAKVILVDTFDIETGQRVTVEATVSALNVDTNAAVPPSLPALGVWGATLLAATLLAMGSVLVSGVRRSES